MAQGNFANGEYFIDCPGISQSALRAIFGVWINICIAAIALCIRFIFRAQIQKRITLGPQGGVSLWRVSPAMTPSEAFEMRGILAKALMKRDFAFVFVSTFCIVTAVVGAASTVISNHAVGMNSVVRDAIVQGRLVTNEHSSVSNALIQVKARADALNGANAPLDELFDFAPGDDSKWIYKPSQWNNTWKGSCSFAKHEAVELTVYPTNSTAYQDEVPMLGDYIPSWATVDLSRQGVSHVGFYIGANDNGTGAWRDMVVTYIFGSTPVGHVALPERSMNLSIVNYLAHHIARDNLGNSWYLESKFRSDIHTAECQFVCAVGVDSGDRDHSNVGGSYQSAAAGIGSVSLLLFFSFVSSCIGSYIIVPLWMHLLPSCPFDSQQDGRCYGTGRLICLSKMRSTRIPWQGFYPSTKQWFK